MRVPTEAQFTDHLLASRLVGTMKHTAEKRTPFHLNRAALKLLCMCSTFRLEKYKYFKLEQLMMNLKQNSTEDTNTGKTIALFWYDAIRSYNMLNQWQYLLLPKHFTPCLTHKICNYNNSDRYV